MEATKRAKLQPVPFQLSLRIRHPSMDPEVISKELRIEPEHSFQAGQLRQLRSGGVSAVHTQSYWLAALDPRRGSRACLFRNLSPSLTQKYLDAAVARNFTWALSLCTARLSKLHGSLLQKIRSEGGEISLLLTLSPTVASSFNLAPEVSRLCGELGITLEFEMTND